MSDLDPATQASLDKTVAAAQYVATHRPALPNGMSRMTARAYLDWVTVQCMHAYDDGQPEAAEMLFSYLVEMHPGTRWVAAHPLCAATLKGGLAGGRGGFESAMRGFNV